MDHLEIWKETEQATFRKKELSCPVEGEGGGGGTGVKKEGSSRDLEGSRAGNVQEEGALLPGPVGGGHEVIGPRYYLKLHFIDHQFNILDVLNNGRIVIAKVYPYKKNILIYSILPE